MTDERPTLPIGTRRFLCVEYPGYVKNVEKALDTLGGLKQIRKVYNNQTKFLRVNYRPEDPFSHPLHGDITSTWSPIARFTVFFCHSYIHTRGPLHGTIRERVGDWAICAVLPVKNQMVGRG